MPCKTRAAMNWKGVLLIPHRIEATVKTPIAVLNTLQTAEAVRHPAADGDKHGERQHIHAHSGAQGDWTRVEGLSHLRQGSGDYRRIEKLHVEGARNKHGNQNRTLVRMIHRCRPPTAIEQSRRASTRTPNRRVALPQIGAHPPSSEKKARSGSDECKIREFLSIKLKF